MMFRIAFSVLLLGAIPPAFADQFDEIDGRSLVKVIGAKDATPSKRLTVGEIAGLPSLLKESRSALLFVKTGAGNYSRMLISPELRKRADGKREPLSVLVVERFDTFDGANVASRLVRGREVVLFDGFEFDLDTGQIVPPGEGGDLVFKTKGEPGARLEVLGETRIVTPRALPVPEAGAAPRPTPGRAVVPTDFSGRYRLFSNGQWSGMLEITADAKGAVVGRFRSDAQGTAYAVTGQVSAEAPQRVQFAIKFPRSQLDLDGYLWTDGKGAMAGTASLLEKTFGFFAVREGGRIAPDGVEVRGLDSPSR